MKLPLFCLTHLAFLLWLASPLFAAPVRLVLDTDMSGDCDDAGALALLQALTDRGECELLATVINRKDFTGASAAATDAINTFYGRPDLPIGTDKQGPTALRRTSAFARALRDEFPSDIGPDDRAPDALDVYRRVLAAQPDGSVVICSVGALSNLAELWRNAPDLVRKKVRLLVVMGGQYPRSDKPETNIATHREAAQFVTAEWSGEIVWHGWEVGNVLITGAALKQVPPRNPVRRAYELKPFGNRPAIEGGQASWDQGAALFAVRGAQPEFWEVVRGGRVRVDDRGNTIWETDANARHSYVKSKGERKALAAVIEELMVQPPKQGAGTMAKARTFHVDATHGNDARDGLKPETAWRSLAKVNRASLGPGDRVLFQRGQTWRGQLVPQSGDASGVITYAAFGEGPKPVLLGSVAADRAEDWQSVSQNIWATVPLRFETVGVQADLQQGSWTLHQEGGASCALKSENQNGATQLQLTCRNGGTRGNHLQLSVPGFAVQEGDYYLLTFRAQATRSFTPAAVSLMKSGPPWTAYATTETTLPAIGTNWAEYTIRFHARHSATDARLTVFLGSTLPADSTLLLRPGQLLKVRSNQAIPLSVDIGNIIFDHGQTTGVKKWSEADLHKDGDFFYDARAWQVKLRSEGNPAARHQSIELALNRHIINQGGCGYVAYEDLDLRYGAAHGVGGGSTHHITVRGCDVSWIGGGHQFTRPDGKPVRFGNGIEFWSDAHDCLVEDCRIWEIYDAALTNQGDGTNVQENITYRRNVIWNSEYSFEYWNRGPASRTRNIVFEHNTCVDAGLGWGHDQRPDPNGRHLMFYSNTAATTNVVIRGNIFCNATDSLLRLQGRDWTEALMMDGNCWFQPRGPVWLWGQQTIAAEEFAALAHARGFDRHSLLADPKFVSAARHDYRLAPDSPARMLPDQGKAAGALSD